MIEGIFSKLGFNSTSAKVYLTLVESGKTTASMLAKKTKIARTTVYSALELLKAKGLVIVEKKSNVTYFLANKPDVILQLVSDEKKALELKHEVAKQLVNLITPSFRKGRITIPKIQLYESKAGIEAMLYEQSPIWQESIQQYDNTWWGFQDHTFVVEYRKWLDWYWNSMTESETICLLSNKAEVDKPLNIKRRTIKAISKKFNFESTIWVLGDYIVVITNRDEPHHAYQLHDSVLAEGLRMVFQVLWKAVG